MKKLSLIGLTVCMMFISFGKILSNGDCDWDCSGTTVNVSTSVNFLNCVIQVDYEYRDCGGTPQTVEIHITNVQPLGACSITDFEGMMNTVNRQVLEESAVPISSPGDGYLARLKTYKCWRLQTIPVKKYVPCDNSECCIAEYELYTDGGLGNLVVAESYTKETPDTEDCGIIQSCQYACNTLDVEEGWPVLVPGPNTRNCAYSCEINWSPGKVVTAYYPPTGQSSATITAYYYERECDNDLEIKLESIIIKEDYPVSSADIYKRAIERALYEYGMDGYSSVTLISAKCWERNNTLLNSCGPVACCYTEYSLSKSGDVVTCNPTPSTVSDDGDCPGSGCENLCTYQDEIRLNTNLAKERVSEAETGNMKEILSISFVKPNPAKGEIEILYTSSERGKTILKIYNSIGIMVIELNINKTSNEAVWKFDTSLMPNGSYYYNIMTTDKISVKGTFIISR